SREVLPSPDLCRRLSLQPSVHRHYFIYYHISSLYRVSCSAYRPADDEIVSPLRYCFAWCHDALLVISRGKKRTDTRSNYQEIRTACLPDQPHLLGRANHPVHTSALGELCQANDHIRHRMLDANTAQRFFSR